MAKLNQLIAVEKTLKGDTAKVFNDAYHNLQKPALLAGLLKTYQPRDEDGEQLPGEQTRVQVRVPEVIADVKAALVKLFDLTATKDTTNQVAVADIILPGGTMLAERVSVSTLLFLEKQLTDLRTFVMKLPILDPAEVWTEADQPGAWRAEPVRTVRTKKIPRNHVKAQATDKHPAQVEIYYEDATVGTWTTTRFSGAIGHRDARAILDRVSVLTEAVKQAREFANGTQIVDKKIGDAVLGYLFG